jgi:hypothetical protein
MIYDGTSSLLIDDGRVGAITHWRLTAFDNALNLIYFNLFYPFTPFVGLKFF